MTLQNVRNNKENGCKKSYYSNQELIQGIKKKIQIIRKNKLKFYKLNLKINQLIQKKFNNNHNQNHNNNNNNNNLKLKHNKLSHNSNKGLGLHNNKDKDNNIVVTYLLRINLHNNNNKDYLLLKPIIMQRIFQDMERIISHKIIITLIIVKLVNNIRITKIIM